MRAKLTKEYAVGSKYLQFLAEKTAGRIYTAELLPMGLTLSALSRTLGRQSVWALSERSVQPRASRHQSENAHSKLDCARARKLRRECNSQLRPADRTNPRHSLIRVASFRFCDTSWIARNVRGERPRKLNETNTKSHKQVTTYAACTLHLHQRKLFCYPVNHTGKILLQSQNKAVAITLLGTTLFVSGKALLEIAGKPMICCVVEQALAARNVARAIVATDDQRIAEVVRSAGYEVVMTRNDHKSGTDRIAEVAASLDDVDIIVNVQGDEPLISPLTIERAVEAIAEEENRVKGERGKGKGEEGTRSEEDAETQRHGDSENQQFGIVTTWEPMESAADALNPDVVKIVVDDNDRAIYFSRSPCPSARCCAPTWFARSCIGERTDLLIGFRKHTGLYVYRRDVLLEFTRGRNRLWNVGISRAASRLERRVKIKRSGQVRHYRSGPIEDLEGLGG